MTENQRRAGQGHWALRNNMAVISQGFLFASHIPEWLLASPTTQKHQWTQKKKKKKSPQKPASSSQRTSKGAAQQDRTLSYSKHLLQQNIIVKNPPPCPSARARWQVYTPTHARLHPDMSLASPHPMAEWLSEKSGDP